MLIIVVRVLVYVNRIVSTVFIDVHCLPIMINGLPETVLEY